MDKIAVLIPCYNESRTVAKVVADFKAALPEGTVIYVYDNNSTDGTAEIAAAVGVACHEVGHAIQHSVGYVPVKVREAIVPVTNLGAKLSVPLIILGLLLGSLSPVFIYAAYIGVALYGLCALFQLVTLPTEFNASSRALATIEGMELLRGEELDGAAKVLRAAALTYVAALAVTLMQLLRFVLILSNRRD